MTYCKNILEKLDQRWSKIDIKDMKFNLGFGQLDKHTYRVSILAESQHLDTLIQAQVIAENKDELLKAARLEIVGYTNDGETYKQPNKAEYVLMKKLIRHLIGRQEKRKLVDKWEKIFSES